MVHTNIGEDKYKLSYKDAKKGKEERAIPGQHRDLRQSSGKTDKYGSWGPVYKNKQNFVDMHIC